MFNDSYRSISEAVRQVREGAGSTSLGGCWEWLFRDTNLQLAYTVLAQGLDLEGPEGFRIMTNGQVGGGLRELVEHSPRPGVVWFVFAQAES